MFETLLIAGLTLLIVLYAQTRLMAHRIRCNRAQSNDKPSRDLILKRRV